jgi:hypothetical protein
VIRDAAKPQAAHRINPSFRSNRSHLAALATTLAALTALLAPAFANAAPLPTHHLLETFGSAAQPTFTTPGAAGMAVDQSTGDLLVINKAANTVERFNEDGTPSNFSATATNALTGFAFNTQTFRSQVSVDNSGTATDGNIYVAQTSAATKPELKLYDKDGNALTTLTQYKAGPNGEGAATAFAEGICGVAVGPEGDLYVAEYGEPGQVHKYEPSGAVPGAADNTLNFSVNKPCLLAAGAGPTAGSLFAYRVAEGVYKFNASTGAQAYEATGSTGAISVDPVSGHLYAGTVVGEVVELNVSGASAATVSATQLGSNARGVAVDANSGRLYTARSGGANVEAWGPGAAHSITVAPTGSGKVSQTGGSEALSGSISECEEAGGACSATYFEGQGPQLTATANASNEFKAWTVEHAAATTCSGTTSPCAIEVGSEDVAAKAEFALSGFELKVQKEGNGTGTIESDVAGAGANKIECGPRCSEAFAPSTVVKLTGAADPHSEAVVWTSGCDAIVGSNECEVTMSAAREVKASFTRFPHTLSVTPTGEGKVSAVSPPTPSSGSITNCEEAGGTCSALYGEGETVELQATPGPHQQVSWTGCTSEAGNACQITIPASDANVEAHFTQITHTLSVSATGQGKVSAVPPPAPNSGSISNCEAGGGSCSAVYDAGDSIELQATPGPHQQVAWTGCTTEAGDTCHVTIPDGSDPGVEAHFTQITHTLTVNPTGSGKVSAVPPPTPNSGSISNCEAGGGSCSAVYNAGASVELQATPASGFEVEAWSGCTTEAGDTCHITIPDGSDPAVSVSFVLEAGQVVLQTQTTGSGSGQIKCDGGACQSTYAEGTIVTLQAEPALHSSFTGWTVTGSGATTTPCTGTTSPCEVKLEAPGPLSATAQFSQITHTLSMSNAGTGSATTQCKEDAGSFGSCAVSFKEGHQVTVKVTPDAHNAFKEFKAGTGSATSCNGVTTNECAFTIEADSALTQETDKITHTLAITLAGSGSGGVECKFGAGSFTSCSGPHNEGEAVEVKGTANSGSTFAGWSAGSGSAASCTGTAICSFNLEANSALTATFTAFLKLTASKEGAGEGTITSIPSGINCGAECEHEYSQGTIVTLEQEADSGSVFVEWTGACTGSGACHVTMSAAKAVVAVFAKAQRALTIKKAGAGNGSVSCDGGACASSYPQGTSLTLTASPDASSTFSGWSGAGCSGSGSCLITINADTTVTASFDKKPEGGGGSGGGGGNGGSETPEGTPKAASTASVSANSAALKISCEGSGSCKGQITLKAKVKQGKKQKTVVIGKASYEVPAGGSQTVKVKITNAQVKKELSEGKTVKAKLSGTGIKSATVKLKPAKAKKKHKRNGGAGR